MKIRVNVAWIRGQMRLAQWQRVFLAALSIWLALEIDAWGVRRVSAILFFAAVATSFLYHELKLRAFEAPLRKVLKPLLRKEDFGPLLDRDDVEDSVVSGDKK